MLVGKHFPIVWNTNFLKNKNIMLGNIIPMELSELEVQDIDNEIDWQMAELKYKMMK